MLEAQKDPPVVFAEPRSEKVSPPAQKETLPGRRDLLRCAVVGLGVALIDSKLPSSVAYSQELKPTPTPQQIAAAVVGSSLGLIVRGEGAPGIGSATLVEVPPTMRMLLHPDEVLAVSVSHNFSDWNEQSKAMALRYTQVSPDGKCSAPVKYEARLIERFIGASDRSNPFPRLGPAPGCVDVSLIAVKIPAGDRANVDKLLVPMAEPTTVPPTRASFVAVGYGDHTPEGLRGQGRRIDLTKESPPVSWRQGSIAGTFTSDCVTQYGPLKETGLRTNAPTVPGDSGGGLFMWNPVRQRIELLGVCSTGDRVGKGVTDFDELVPELSRMIGLPPGVDASGFSKDAIVYRSEGERKALEEKFRRQAAGWLLDSDFRAHFEHISSVHALVDRTVVRYEALLEERKRILAAVNRLEGEAPVATILPGVRARRTADVALLRERALKPIEEEIASLKPPR